MTSKNNKKILGIIPARGGSKGIPKKNIVKVLGRPLIAWTIDAAEKSKYIDKIVVSSENKEILEIGKKYGAQPIKRPMHLATDKASPEPLVFQVMEYLKKKDNYTPDILVYLQPTSPLRGGNDIDQAVQKLLNNNAQAIISVYELEKKYLKTFITNESGQLKGTVNNRYPFMNRQQLPSVYMPNGAIYVITRKAFINTGQLFAKKTLPFVMSIEKSFDLDTPEDLKNLRKYLRRKKIYA